VRDEAAEDTDTAGDAAADPDTAGEPAGADGEQPAEVRA
jgi:hypothetical protein